MKKLIFFFAILHLHSLTADWHTIYAHGIIDDQTQIQRFIEAISTPQTTTVEFCDAQKAANWGLNGYVGSLCHTILGKNINRANMCMGQTNDITTLHNVIQNQCPNDSLILYGCSRGAATIINTLTQNHYSNIKALVLDATPADMPATIKPMLAKLGINPDYADTIFSIIFPAYPKNSTTPLQAIQHIANKDLPILLIHSLTDQKIPVQHSYQLYQEFIRQGFTNVEIVILPEGAHSYLLQNEKIKPLYLQAVHSFYKKYNLPHDTAWAQQNFDQFKHSFENLEYELDCYHKSIEATYKKTIIKYFTFATVAAIIIALFLKQSQSKYF